MGVLWDFRVFQRRSGVFQEHSRGVSGDFRRVPRTFERFQGRFRAVLCRSLGEFQGRSLVFRVVSMAFHDVSNTLH